MFCSVIIPTIGRASLARAVASVLDQADCPASFELIVVNDSGRPLPPQSWQSEPRVRLITTQRRWQSVARNVGAAVAAGTYLLFLDDDDWLRPGALAQFWQLAQRWPEAGVLGAAFALVDEHGEALHKTGLTRQGNCAVQLVSGFWLQLAAALIRADHFFAVGGFAPTMRTSEDLDLLNRLALRTDFAGADFVAAHIDRAAGRMTTVDYSAIYETNRLARDRALAEPGAFRRLRQSADGAYWHGRLLRVYLVAAAWQGRQGRYLTAFSRAWFGLAALLGAGRHWVAADFWRGMRDSVPRESGDGVMG